tara:strand:+ start:265 stop:561 length:297 start_codon:yes stop_codon:yes gene_type:complete
LQLSNGASDVGRILSKVETERALFLGEIRHNETDPLAEWIDLQTAMGREIIDLIGSEACWCLGVNGYHDAAFIGDAPTVAHLTGVKVANGFVALELMD